MPGIGHRLDAWVNHDLNVGAIVAIAPNLKPITYALGVDEATVTEDEKKDLIEYLKSL